MSLVVPLLVPTTVIAQHGAHGHEAGDAAPGWTWNAEGTAFLTANLQERRFRDFHQVESQNWWMAAATRRAGRGTLTLHGMLSLEPWTLRALGSSQAFQTGETFGGAPLIDYQHPHDLIVNASVSYEHALPAATLVFGGGLVDAPALGPTPFMHRATAALHPTVPLTHHQLDSTHITHGSITVGVRRGAWQVDASTFRGREPDEDRVDLDLGALDSWAVRSSWTRGGTRAQLSVGTLHEPEAVEPGDVTRLTASLEHAGRLVNRDISLTVAWGRNEGRLNTAHGLLAEAVLGLGAGNAYVRAELVDKHILEAGGLHPPGFEHPHELSRVGALTAGYQHHLWRGPTGAPFGATWSVGADITGHAVPSELADAYGRPVSVHLYGRVHVARRPPRP